MIASADFIRPESIELTTMSRKNTIEAGLAKVLAGGEE
jgi:hypothetical protein